MTWPRVKDKADFYDRFLAGEFGNKVPHFTSFLKYYQWCWDMGQSLKSVQCMGFSNGLPMTGVRGMRPGMEFITVRDAYEAEKETIRRGWCLGDYMVGLGTPDHLLTLNGELIEEHGEPWLSYSTAPVTMRVAMREPHVRRARGVRALGICDWYMEPVAADWLRELLARYPGHAIEFSTYRLGLGDLGWNTVFWEVRDY